MACGAKIVFELFQQFAGVQRPPAGGGSDSDQARLSAFKESNVRQAAPPPGQIWTCAGSFRQVLTYSAFMALSTLGDIYNIQFFIGRFISAPLFRQIYRLDLVAKALPVYGCRIPRGL